MFTFNGLETWELVTLSGLLAVCALAIASTIGVAVTYLVTREPRHSVATSRVAANNVANRAVPSSGHATALAS